MSLVCRAPCEASCQASACFHPGDKKLLPREKAVTARGQAGPGQGQAAEGEGWRLGVCLVGTSAPECHQHRLPSPVLEEPGCL